MITNVPPYKYFVKTQRKLHANGNLYYDSFIIEITAIYIRPQHFISVEGFSIN